jgi:hypothetical protein
MELEVARKFAATRAEILQMSTDPGSFSRREFARLTHMRKRPSFALSQ